MAHVVTCVKCGRSFDRDKEGYGRFYPGRGGGNGRYECKSCTKAQKKKQKEAAKVREIELREKATGMKQSNGAMIAKIAVGALFLVSSFTLIPQGNIGGFFAGVVIAAALVAWGLVPYLKVRKAKQAEAEAQAEEAARAANEPKVCPSCGAVTKGAVCEYCGSKLN